MIIRKGASISVPPNKKYFFEFLEFVDPRFITKIPDSIKKIKARIIEMDSILDFVLKVNITIYSKYNSIKPSGVVTVMVFDVLSTLSIMSSTIGISISLSLALTISKIAWLVWFRI